MTGLDLTIIPRSSGPRPTFRRRTIGISKRSMLAIISRVYDLWTSFQFERQCRRLARGHLAEPDALFEYLSQCDENAACQDALSWITDVLSRARPSPEAELLSPQALQGQLLEAHGRLPTRQRRLLFLYVARGQRFTTFAARLRLPQAQALRELCAAITRFRSELATVETNRLPRN